MTKKLEELLNLPEVKEAIDKAEMDEAKDDDDLMDMVAFDEPKAIISPIAIWSASL